MGHFPEPFELFGIVLRRVAYSVADARLSWLIIHTGMPSWSYPSMSTCWRIRAAASTNCQPSTPKRCTGPGQRGPALDLSLLRRLREKSRELDVGQTCFLKRGHDPGLGRAEAKHEIVDVRVRLQIRDHAAGQFLIEEILAPTDYLLTSASRRASFVQGLLNGFDPSWKMLSYVLIRTNPTFALPFESATMRFPTSSPPYFGSMTLVGATLA